jgi:4-diphosphocytidyl-2-C-methyl-D-erythritol kinase
MTYPFSRCRVRAHAKVNLDLRVVGRRSDGYHELRTVFQALEWHDTVTVSRTDRPLEIAGDPLRMPLDASNLAWRAAVALWRASGRRRSPSGARIAIVKRIPAQAGLGGGSADAAASLVALNRLWQCGLTTADLARIGESLGSDVPFFLTGGTALGLGRGDELYPLPDLPAHAVVVGWPDRGVSTAEAYGWFTERRALRAGSAPAGAPARGWDPDDLESCRNDLEAPVESHRPEIRRIRHLLEASGARLARMSGSGSAVFGLFRSAVDARRAARALRQASWSAVATSTSPRAR